MNHFHKYLVRCFISTNNEKSTNVRLKNFVAIRPKNVIEVHFKYNQITFASLNGNLSRYKSLRYFIGP